MVKYLPTREKEASSRKFSTHLSYNNVQECFELLSSTDQNISTSVAIAEIHQLCKSRRKSIPNIRKKAHDIFKICRVCNKWEDRRSIITCSNCDDHYHKKCYKDRNSTQLNQPFICALCQADPKPLKICSACQQNIKKNEKIGICQTCHYEYHTNCFHKDMKMCKRCVKLTKMLPNDKKKLIQKNNQNGSKQLKINQMFALIAAKNLKKANRLNHLVQNKGHQFLASTLLSPQDTKLIEKYKNKLMEVIKYKQMSYTEYLVDLDNHLNNLSAQSLDFGLANMSKAQEKEYLLYKSQPIGPFSFTIMDEKGVDVVADMDIPQYTIVCEYIGEVMTLRKCIELQKTQHNDSVMELWVGKNSDETLVICPYKWTNIARFLNGVGKRKQEQNVHSIKICFRGKPMILLVTSRKIKKGQSLCYDYNGDIAPKYPTDSFV